VEKNIPFSKAPACMEIILQFSSKMIQHIIPLEYFGSYTLVANLVITCNGL